MSKALDLFCGAGGVARGLKLAGFHVTGIDIAPQPRYAGDTFIQADAMTYPLDGFDFIWASPPCQCYSLSQRIHNREHPDLINGVRDALVASGAPYVIENVEGAPLLNPILLCGAMFDGLRVYRHRLFETSFPTVAPSHPTHTAKVRKMGRPATEDEFMHVVGNFSGAAQARTAMGIDWMTRYELSQAIPPAYSEYIGRQAIAKLPTPSTPEIR